MKQVLVFLLVLGSTGCKGQPQPVGPWENEKDLPAAMAILKKDGAKRAIQYAENRGVTAYDVGIHLLGQGKTQQAKTWFQDLGIATNESQYLYGIAYVEFYSGDHIGALKDASFLLSKGPTGKIKARTHYLIGQIKLGARLFDAAASEFEEGLETYRSLDGMYGGEYLCLTMLATVAVSQKNYSRVDELLASALAANNKLKDIGKKPYSLGTYYEIYGAKNFWSGEYTKALDMFLKAETEFNTAQRPEWALGARVKVGLCRFLIGDVEEAFEISNSIWEMVKDDKHKSQIRAYNNLTLAKISQCSGHTQDYAGRKRSILAWANANEGGEEVKALLDAVDKAPCPEIK